MPRLEGDVLKMALTPDSINMRNWGSEERLERMQKAVAAAFLDVRKDERRKRGECKSCYYLRVGVVAGQAFSSRPCKNESCSNESKHANTDVPDYCIDCSTTYGICRRCGADLEFKVRKSLKPPRRT